MYFSPRPAYVLLLVLATTGASAEYCYSNYNLTVPLVQPDGEPLHITALFVTKLNNVHLVWTDGSEGDAIELSIYTPDDTDDILDFLRISMATDESERGTLQLDAKDDLDVCLYVKVPNTVNMRRLTVEGMAEVNLGPLVDDAFQLVVNNGYIRSEEDLFVEELELMVLGNGAIVLEPSQGSDEDTLMTVRSLSATLSGSGNITFEGKVRNADVEVDGEGKVKIGTVSKAATLDLQGRIDAGGSNTTVAARGAGIDVTGRVGPDNYVTIVGGPSCSGLKPTRKGRSNNCREVAAATPGSMTLTTSG